MEFSGSCYCGALRYQASGEPLFKALCHCKQCQMFSGGMAALLIGMPKANFSYTQGKPAIADNRYSDANAHREFCAECGTHILAVSDASPDMVSIKAGTMDDRSLYGEPEMALQMADSHSYHAVPDGVATFEHWPWS